MYIGRKLPFIIDLSLESSRGVTSEGQQDLDHFDAASPLMLRQIDLFNVLVSGRRLIHRNLQKKPISQGNLTQQKLW